jgi:hypothetical protein
VAWCGHLLFPQKLLSWHFNSELRPIGVTRNGIQQHSSRALHLIEVSRLVLCQKSAVDQEINQPEQIRLDRDHGQPAPLALAVPSLPGGVGFARGLHRHISGL